jgi:hypothetical protein
MSGKHNGLAPGNECPGRKAVTRRKCVMSVSGPVIRSFGKTIAAVFTSLIEDVLGAYRPERHYMRGPGPKWREKHALAPAAPGPALDARRELTKAAA